MALKTLHETWLRESTRVVLGEKQQQSFTVLLDCLMDTQGKMNVTAVKTADGVVLRHFADSLSLCDIPALQEAKTVADIGCGGGIPGLAIKIALPHMQITMIDSTEKKLRFVSRCAAQMGLQGVKVAAGRAEELSAPSQRMREAFDVVIARAVASLDMLDELCLPFVKKGGVFLAMKGPKVFDEVKSAQSGIAKLGGKYGKLCLSNKCFLRRKRLKK